MAKGPRTRNAKIRASFGRAERLRSERENGRPDRDPERRQKGEPAVKARHREAAQARSSRQKEQRRPTPLHRVEERVERSRSAAERKRLERLERQTRTAFNREGERRRDADRRTEHDRAREVQQANARRLEEHKRVANRRRLDRKRGEQRREFSRVAGRRRDAARRADFERQKALAADRQRRAALEVEKEQKRRAADQQAAQRRQTDAMRARHKVERNSYRQNELDAQERHHHAIRGIDRRADRELADFDGRRRGLAGRVAELVPGRREENDRKREEMVRGFEVQRQTKHRELEALKERQFERAQQARLDRQAETKALIELQRSERGNFARQQADDRPRQVEVQARVIERVERAYQQERDRERQFARPTGEFARAASDRAHEPAGAVREFKSGEGQDLIRQAQVFGRA